MRKSKSDTKRFKLSVTNYAKFITKDNALPCKINKLPKGQCTRYWHGPGQNDKINVILSIFISLLSFLNKIMLKNAIFSYVGKIKKDDLSETIYLERRSFQHLERLRKKTIFPTFGKTQEGHFLSLIHIWRCRRSTLCRSRWSPYH